MKFVLSSLTCWLIAFAISQSAYAEVVFDGYQVKCEPGADYFYWRAFASTDLDVGDPLQDVTSIAPPSRARFIEAGFQFDPVTYCDLQPSVPDEPPTRIIIAADDWFHDQRLDPNDPRDAKRFRSSYQAGYPIELTILDRMSLTLEPIRDDKSWSEQFVEIAGSSGKHCVVHYQYPEDRTFTSEPSPVINQEMSCRFFEVPRFEDTAQEGR